MTSKDVTFLLLCETPDGKIRQVVIHPDKLKMILESSQLFKLQVLDEEIKSLSLEKFTA